MGAFLGGFDEFETWSDMCVLGFFGCGMCTADVQVFELPPQPLLCREGKEGETGVMRGGWREPRHCVVRQIYALSREGR